MTWMIIAALLPALVLGLYIYFRDPVKEPFSWLLRTFIAGVCICVPVAFVEAGISHLIFGDGSPATLCGTTVQAFFVAAVPEEAAKLLVLWLILRRNPYFDEHFDGIVYAVCVGLGFAAIENVAYVMQAGEGWITVAAMRALLPARGSAPSAAGNPVPVRMASSGRLCKKGSISMAQGGIRTAPSGA